MARITSKLQVTLPKALAKAHGITAGSEVTFESMGSALLVRPATSPLGTRSVDERLAVFDASTERLRSAPERCAVPTSPDAPVTRGWTRDEL